MIEHADFVEASAPGRIDVMGGIADYSGSMVLQMALNEKTFVSVRLRNDFQCHLKSETSQSGVLTASLDYRALLNNGKVDLTFARAYFETNRQAQWAAYVLGCALVLQQEKGIDFRGADFNIHSEIPLGKGVSSSAALEVATMRCFSIIYQLTFEGNELPHLAQRVENLVVGAPCGLMDQLSSCFGKPGTLLPIVCQPDLLKPEIAVPGNLAFVGIDSGVRHAVGGSGYSNVRCAAFMGYSMIAREIGVDREELNLALSTGQLNGFPFGGYLCNISVDEFEKKYVSLLPDQITGRDFMKLYGSKVDTVTTIKGDDKYHVKVCTAHPIYENERVRRFIGLLMSDEMKGPNRDDTLAKMGELMFAAHESYSACGLGSAVTDEIVKLAKGQVHRGIIGAKITGGGSGGTVCLMVIGEQGLSAARELHHHLEIKYNRRLAFFDSRPRD